DGQVMAEQPFDSRRKRMSIVHLTRTIDGFERIVYTKGGIREMLDICNNILIDGQVLPLTQEHVAQIMAVNDSYATKGLRVLAASQRTLKAEEQDYSIDALENGQTFLG